MHEPELRHQASLGALRDVGDGVLQGTASGDLGELTRFTVAGDRLNRQRCQIDDGHHVEAPNDEHCGAQIVAA